MTKIVATIGPASESEEMLKYFYNNRVSIARLNTTYNTHQWHIKIGKLAKKIGMERMLDLTGPKIIFGLMQKDQTLPTGYEFVLEKQQDDKKYPYTDKEGLVLPTAFDLTKFMKPDHQLLGLDGTVEIKIQKVSNSRVYCKTIFGGVIKSHKGMNSPDADFDIDFLTPEDRAVIESTIAEIRPEYCALSFVKTGEDIDRFHKYLKSVLKDKKITDYYPKIVIKVETKEAVAEKEMSNIVKKGDIVMIARGDLSLETKPLYVATAFDQDRLANESKKQGKPFIIATQMVENMINNPVPTRAEVSDIYRAVVINEADYIMLSGESAVGKYPKKVIDIMNSVIDEKIKRS